MPDFNWNILSNLPDIGTNAVNAFNQGRQQAMTQSVGQKVAAGDYAGGSQEAFKFGDLGLGQQLINQNDVNQEHALALQKAQEDRARELQLRKITAGTSTAYGLTQVTDPATRSAMFDASVGSLKANGWTDQELAVARQNLNTPGYLEGLVHQGLSYQDQYTANKDNRDFALKSQEQAFTQAQPKIVTGPNGEVYVQQPVPVGASINGGQTGFVANSNGTVQPGGITSPSAPVSRQAFGQAIVQQESRGNYSAVSPKGALGAYQVMPQTGQVLAQRLGLPWQPNLMVGTSPEAKAYQDKIGNAAIDEAWQAGNGNIQNAAMYYHGGSDHSKWGPLTRQYGQDVLGRLGVQGGGQPSAGGYTGGAPGQIVPGFTQVIAGKPLDNWSPGVQNGLTGQFNAKDHLFKPDPGQGTSNNKKVDPGQAIANIQSAIATVDRLKVHPGLSAAVGSAFDPHSWFSINPRTGKPFAGTEAANFDSELQTLKSQAFLAQIGQMKGMGALSDAEGAALTKAIGDLSTDMSESAFQQRLDLVRKTFSDGLARLQAQPQQQAQTNSGWKVIR